MRVILKYGTTGLPLDLPETPGFAGILAPSEPEMLSEPRPPASDPGNPGRLGHPPREDPDPDRQQMRGRGRKP